MLFLVWFQLRVIRWSDLRYIHHVVAEEGRNGFLTLYTAEHKTSAVGARREQYLPPVMPWMGVTHDEWVKTFMDVYKMAGLDLFKVPLGPLLPAPRMGGSFERLFVAFVPLFVEFCS